LLDACREVNVGIGIVCMRSHYPGHKKRVQATCLDKNSSFLLNL